MALATGTNTVFLDTSYKIQEDGRYHVVASFTRQYYYPSDYGGIPGVDL